MSFSSSVPAARGPSEVLCTPASATDSESTAQSSVFDDPCIPRAVPELTEAFRSAIISRARHSKGPDPRRAHNLYDNTRPRFRLHFNPTSLKITNAAGVFSQIANSGNIRFRKVKRIQVSSHNSTSEILGFLETTLDDPRVKSALITLNFLAVSGRDKLTTYNAMVAVERFLETYAGVHQIQLELNILHNGVGYKRYTPSVSQLSVLREVLFGLLGP